MENKREVKIIAIVALLVAVVGLSVAYAALSTSLSISGTATVNSATWQVEFVKGAWDTPVGTAVTSGPEFGVTLVKPGDKAVYRFKVHNKGTIPAKLSAGTSVGTISCTGGANQSEADTTCSNIVYSLTYAADGKTPAAGDTLAASEQKDLILTVEFKSTATTIPSSAVTVNGISATLEYVQG